MEEEASGCLPCNYYLGRQQQQHGNRHRQLTRLQELLVVERMHQKLQCAPLVLSMKSEQVVTEMVLAPRQ